MSEGEQPDAGASQLGASQPEARMRIGVFSVLPSMVTAALSVGPLRRAQAAGLVVIDVHDVRDYAHDRHRSVDDSPFGGGAGMVLSAAPLFAAVEAVAPPRPLWLLGPGGRRFDQAMAAEMAVIGGFSLVCGRYEGVDDRVRRHLCEGELSIGDFVLAGGEAAAVVVIEAVTRLVPGVMGNDASAAEESFCDGLLEYPQYTRPAVFREFAVPEVLLSGDHARVRRWRRAQALSRTMADRPDLIEARGGLSFAEAALLEEWPPSD